MAGGDEKDHESSRFILREEGPALEADGFVTMDYTPARKKPPIHN